MATGEFTINSDPERGIRVLGHFEPDGKMHVKVLPYIPDSFFDTLKAMRESFALRKQGTQSPWLPLPVLPTAPADHLLRDGAGKPLPLTDPQRDKRHKRIHNHIYNMTLRIFDGLVSFLYPTGTTTH